MILANWQNSLSVLGCTLTLYVFYTGYQHRSRVNELRRRGFVGSSIEESMNPS
jgi:hypothetical protein